MLTDSLDKALSLPDGITSAVSFDGDLITRDRFYKSGSKNKQAGIRLGIKDKLEKLQSKLSGHTQDYEKAEAELAAVEEKLKNLNPDTVRQLIKEKQKEARKLEQEISRYQSGIQVYQKNIGDLPIEKRIFRRTASRQKRSSTRCSLSRKNSRKRSLS